MSSKSEGRGWVGLCAASNRFALECLFTACIKIMALLFLLGVVEQIYAEVGVVGQKSLLKICGRKRLEQKLQRF
ncbi:hypothetical protein FKM82_006579 [Ascaphus truei]